jgi:hypothetical protein
VPSGRPSVSDCGEVGGGDAVLSCCDAAIAVDTQEPLHSTDFGFSVGVSVIPEGPLTVTTECRIK